MSHPTSSKSYYLPDPSHWPLVGCFALLCAVIGAANWLHGKAWGPYLCGFGVLSIFYLIFGWFGTVIRENRAGLLDNEQVDRSFRWGMAWFIFSEVMFFATFFGALFYTRQFVIPWLGGHGHQAMTHIVLWPDFHSHWPVYQTPDPSQFLGPRAIMETWGIPAINTAILLTSGVTITFAHWGVMKNSKKQAIIAQTLTVLLGIAFLTFQMHEYGIAYMEKGLKLSSGIYGSTFFMLTGFHALHVTIGTICLIVILWRLCKSDFNSDNHFGFEGVAWYWHFVDVVWLMLFIFVYWV